MSRNGIPFNRPYMTGRELDYIAEAHAHGHLAGDGIFTKRCHAWLERTTGAKRALLTHSCTAALEMAAILTDVGPGDEIIMPSYTFVSTANAFALRGATPVFVDIRPDTLNLDEKLVAAAITERTRAIVPVHYAGVSCDMDTIAHLADDYRLWVVEDAAQAIQSTWKGKPLGSLGHLACLSFHETKNVIAGEGGALLVNDERLVERAEIIREKGTNRSKFFRGQVDKYTWVDIGSSYLPGEVTAAFLAAQLEHADEITAKRLDIWKKYFVWSTSLESAGLERPFIPDQCLHNAHMFYLLLPDIDRRTRLIEHLRTCGISAVFHYIPLHSAPAGRRFGRAAASLPLTERTSDRLVRLPLWIGIEPLMDRIIRSAEIELIPNLD